MSDENDVGDRTPVEVFRDERGALTLFDLESLPFSPSRVYVLHDIPPGGRRGGHASRSQHRFVAVIAGRARITLDDGRREERRELGPGDGAHIAPGTWNELEADGPGLVVLVCASGAYDRGDYVADRAELPLTATTASHTAVA